MLDALERLGRADSARKRKQAVREAVRMVAKTLKNTPAVCRKYYIHPRVIEAYEQDALTPAIAESARRAERNKRELDRLEETLLLLLEGD